uniref:Partner and localizer of BRCA2 n=1 Tax=Bubo bubo TaxID=30461 RepID=A0A8C0FV92_BUBBB
PTGSRDNISPSGELHGLLDVMSENEVLPADGNNTIMNDSKSREGNCSDTNDINPLPADLAPGNVEELLENQQLEIQSRLPHPEEVTAPDSALNSCTVVEGLLFPVEYYVRTTRRMSNCQRKVDLDAVILSQLGRSKKGQRSKCKQKDANSDWPSQERVENDLESEIMLFPFLGAENDPASSSSPQKSLPVSSGKTEVTGAVQPASTDPPPGESQVLGKCCKTLSEQVQNPLQSSSSLNPGNETFSSHIGDLEANLSVSQVDKQGCGSPESSDGPASLGLPAEDPDTCSSLFSFRSLQGLAPRLGIRDFHLPDEDFGLLKLEKLESSPVNDLEVFVPSVFGDGVAAEDMQDAQMNPEEKSLKSNLILPFNNGLPKLPHVDSPASKKELSTHELLFTPTGTVLAGAPTQPESQIFSSAFPVVGATPAVSPLSRSQVFPVTPSVPASQASLRSPEGASAQLTPVPLDDLQEESLQLVSKLKDCSSSCAVDVSTVWWEAAGCRELCVVTASESSVSLWKPLPAARWGRVYTWLFGEIPVIQIVPLPDTCNLVCIALGDLEIGEIRLLLYSSENDSFKQSLVKTGNIKAVLGLKGRRLVSSSRTVQEQQVEIVSVAAGRKGRKHFRCGETLMPPEETVLAFAEVEGMRDALVGTTAVNSVVVWNLKTGQLLRKMHIGYSYPASICHRAYSDAGLLFVVLSHPHAKESESCGNAAFRVIAFNPKTARSTAVTFSSLPPGHAGRYLEGDVKDASATAVLTSGAIAVWDLLLGPTS